MPKVNTAESRLLPLGLDVAGHANVLEDVDIVKGPARANCNSNGLTRLTISNPNDPFGPVFIPVPTSGNETAATAFFLMLKFVVPACMAETGFGAA